MFKKILSWVVGMMPWETVVGYLIEMAVNLLSQWLNSGQPFTKKAKYFTMLVYVACEGIGEELAADSRTTVDDKAIVEAKRLCEQLAVVQAFKLPDVQEL